MVPVEIMTGLCPQILSSLWDSFRLVATIFITQNVHHLKIVQVLMKI